MEPLLTHLLTRWTYAALLCLLLAAGFGVPISEDLTLITAAVLAARGYTQIVPTLIIGYCGVVLGDVLVFAWGRQLGPRAMALRHVQRIVTPERQTRVRRLFERFGTAAVIIGRHLPGLRPVVFFLAGTEQMAPWKFILADAFSSALTVPAVVLIAYNLGRVLDAEHLHDHVRRVQFVAFGLVAIGLLILALIIRRARRRSL